MSDPEAPGWQAIDRALEPIYGDQKPQHFSTIISWRLGGPDPLQGISAYARSGPVPHWHFVTYGLTELYGKESDDREHSGWGFELTLRLRREPDETEVPRWALNFLQNLARYVFESRNVLSAGDHKNLNGPIMLEGETQLRAILVAPDPEMTPIDTPNGRVAFLQVVGITDDEEDAAKLWRTTAMLEIFASHLPLLVTDVRRGSLMALPEVRKAVDDGSRRDGSNTGHLFVDQLAWDVEKRLLRRPLLHITLGARQVASLCALLARRLPFGRPFSLIGSAGRVTFEPAAANGHVREDGVLRLQLCARTVDALRERLAPREGVYPIDDLGDVTLAIQVVKTQIKDAGGQVVETIG